MRLENAKREYEKYMNEQMNILKIHHERIMLRLMNKYQKLFFPTKLEGGESEK